MKCRYGLVVRLVGLALLLLAVSPLTAPFSTCDPTDLFGGATAPAPAAVQSKIQSDEPAADLASPLALHLLLAASPLCNAAQASRPRAVTPLDVPLRL